MGPAADRCRVQTIRGVVPSPADRRIGAGDRILIPSYETSLARIAVEGADHQIVRAAAGQCRVFVLVVPDDEVPVADRDVAAAEDDSGGGTALYTGGDGRGLCQGLLHLAELGLQGLHLALEPRDLLPQRLDFIYSLCLKRPC